MAGRHEYSLTLFNRAQQVGQISAGMFSLVGVSCSEFPKGYPMETVWCTILTDERFPMTSTSFNTLGATLATLSNCDDDICSGDFPLESCCDSETQYRSLRRPIRADNPLPGTHGCVVQHSFLAISGLTPFTDISSCRNRQLCPSVHPRIETSIQQFRVMYIDWRKACFAIYRDLWLSSISMDHTTIYNIR